MIRYLPSAFGSRRLCPVCNTRASRFGRFGVARRDDAQCLWCGALERHRLTWLYFIRRTDLFDGRPKNLLHVAPEECFEKRLKRHLGNGYLTADIDERKAMMQMDITDIPYPDDSFDVIYCSHVLEHVEDDGRAIGECFRVLKPGGWAILLVPITVDETSEDVSAENQALRVKLFGQADHVRAYGRDYVQRLRDGGFIVSEAMASDFLSESEMEQFGINAEAGEIFYCTKEG